MFTFADYDTLVGQVTPDGVVCLVALYMESPQPIDRLANLCRQDERTLKRNVIAKCELHNYAATNGIGYFITEKAKTVIKALVEAIANLLGLQAHSQSTPANPISPQAPLPLLNQPAHNARASDQIILSDQDQNLKSDQERSDQSERTRRAEVETLLNAYRVKEPARSQLLADNWCTADRFKRAITRAQNNPNRRSPSPLGLALHELQKHIDTTPEPDVSEPEDDAEQQRTIDPVSASWLKVIKR